MGATHKETVTELVKAMIRTGHIKPKQGAAHPLRDILRQSILLVEYGVKTYHDPETKRIVDEVLEQERNDKKKSATRVTSDLNTLRKQNPKPKK